MDGLQTALLVSNLLLWLIIILLLVAVYALVRQIGVLHERVAPVGAMMPTSGPRIGETLAPMDIEALDGSRIQIGVPADKRMLIYFLSPSCPVCKSLLPVVKDMVGQEADSTRVIYASDGEQPQVHHGYVEEQELPASAYVVSRDLGIALGVSKLPFAVLVSDQGVLRGRGLVNTREHLESLLEADEMDVATLQEYLGVNAAGDAR